jgi:hypothetical protein
MAEIVGRAEHARLTCNSISFLCPDHGVRSHSDMQKRYLAEGGGIYILMLVDS